MKVTVQLVREGKEMIVELPDKATVKDLLKKIGYRVQGSVVVKDGLPVVENERLNDGDTLQVFLAASGG
ncbi:MoaD/ThiS family protein [Sulfurisphaera javensis]|uniref:MoaD/ThiS family protein n=1 Tax=Sulfurisphaera javensis TaxID=2049879 RepID=A0AAT9GMJ7_9CREN